MVASMISRAKQLLALGVGVNRRADVRLLLGHTYTTDFFQLHQVPCSILKAMGALTGGSGLIGADC